MEKLRKVFSWARATYHPMIFLFLFLISGVFFGQKIVYSENLWYDDIKDEINFLKEYDWKGSLGGIVLREGKKDYKIEGCTQFLQSPKKYISLNAIYPEIIGVAGVFNFKKALGDFWFRVCTKIDEEAREKLEEKFKFFKFIRIDIGGYFGWDTTDSGNFKGGIAFKVIEWKF